MTLANSPLHMKQCFGVKRRKQSPLFREQAVGSTKRTWTCLRPAHNNNFYHGDISKTINLIRHKVLNTLWRCCFLYTSNQKLLCFLTFNANQHEFIKRQRTVVGHNLCGLHAAQVDLAKVLLAGESCQGHVGQVGMFGHLIGKSREKSSLSPVSLTEAQFNWQAQSSTTVYLGINLTF